MGRVSAGAGRGALFAGIDCGSSFCKGALLRDGDVVALACRPTGWNVKECGRLVLEELLEAGVTGAAGEAAAAGLVTLAATGYGREQIAAVTVSGVTVGVITLSVVTLTEISAHARGAEFLFPGVRTVIDIGGQDGKVIAVENGRVRDFQMNDKCAAGCGRFLEMVIKRLELDASRGEVEELLALDKEAPLNSTCAVFAESEIIGLLAAGVSRAAILGGAAASLSRRIAALAGRTGVLSPAVITGGLSESPGIRKILSRVLEAELRPVPHGMYAGAIGAALYAAAQLYK
ncbi:MAG: acyl-CoA dehydratase activase [Spirochaetaceae bacterium]|jgi:predicted CoA-substrate-specific enzyme activase|nr:acyl-CoA dehydratase activase [Spirochaetaceae bacterium]